MQPLSYRALPLLLSFLLLALMGVLRTDGAAAIAAEPEPDPAPTGSDSLFSQVIPFGDSEVRILSDTAFGLCVPVHSITWNAGAAIELNSDDLDGPIIAATVCDLDCDGNLELALTARSCGSGGYTNFLLLERSMGQWTRHTLIPAPTTANEGRMGHESITVWEDAVEVAFPIYAEGDPNCCPTGGTRRIRYGFRAGAFSVDSVSQAPQAERFAD
jgi:hypothetical protein